MRHEKIDIEVGPYLAKCKIVKRSICNCGKSNIPDTLPIGQVFDCDMYSIRWVKFCCHGCGKIHTTRVIDVWDKFLTPHWMLMELFDVGEASFSLPPENVEWQKVKNNEVRPAPTRVKRRILS